MKVETKKDLIEYTALMISSSGFWKPNSDHDLNYTAKEVAEFILENAEVDANWRTILANYHNTHDSLLKAHNEQWKLQRKNRELQEDNDKAAKLIGEQRGIIEKQKLVIDELNDNYLKLASNANHDIREKGKE